MSRRTRAKDDPTSRRCITQKPPVHHPSSLGPINMSRVPNCCTIPLTFPPKIVPSLRTKLVEKRRNLHLAQPPAELPWEGGLVPRTVSAPGSRCLPGRSSLPLIAVAAELGSAASRSTLPGHGAVEPSSHESPFQSHCPVRVSSSRLQLGWDGDDSSRWVGRSTWCRPTGGGGLEGGSGRDGGWSRTQSSEEGSSATPGSLSHWHRSHGRCMCSPE